MPKTNPISTPVFQNSLMCLDRFIICDTSWIKFGNACLIFSSHAFWILADQEKLSIQTFENSKITEGIFQKQTLSEGLVILGKCVLALVFFREFCVDILDA